jgi:23S rRNA pseudouridine2605 synthase
VKKQQKPQPGPAQAERIQKVMAAAGLGSRRALEKKIGIGEVLLNEVKAGLGQTVSEGDTLTFEGHSWRVVSKSLHHRSLIYNKPEGEITARSDPNDRPTVFDRLPFIKDARWVAVGRLDFNTTGLLLMTSDGELAHAMMHPSSNVDREYACRIRGEVKAEQLQNLRQGVELEDGPASFSDIRDAGGSGENHWFHVTIMEGRNREVRRLWKSQGLMVSRLKRVRYGAVFLPKRLRVGQWSEITTKEHEILREDVGLPSTSVSLSLQSIKDRRSRTAGPKRGQLKPKRVKHRQVKRKPTLKSRGKKR